MKNGFFAYWWRVLARSFWDTMATLSSNPVKATMSFMVILIAAIAASFLGYDTWDKVAWAVLVLIIGVAIFLFVWAIFFVRTPWKFENELVVAQQKKHDELLADNRKEAAERTALHEKETAKLFAKIDDLQASINNRHAQHVTEKAEIQKRADNFQAALDDKPATAADVKALLYALVEKGMKMKPRSFVDCKPWFDLRNEILVACFGTHMKREFQLPHNIPDNSLNAQNNLQGWASNLNVAAHSTDHDPISSCTRSVLKTLHEKIASL